MTCTLLVLPVRKLHNSKFLAYLRSSRRSHVILSFARSPSCLYKLVGYAINHFQWRLVIQSPAVFVRQFS